MNCTAWNSVAANALTKRPSAMPSNASRTATSSRNQNGPAFLVVLVAVAVAVLGMALGLFASAFARTEFQAVQFMPAFVLPQFLLCWLLVPREEMPDVLHAISSVLPLSYAVDALRDVTTNAEVATGTWVDLGVVVGAVLLALGLGAATLRRRTA